MTIITRFILRFAALVAITMAVLSSVSVKASREAVASVSAPAEQAGQAEQDDTGAPGVAASGQHPADH